MLTISAELVGDPRFLAILQLEQHVFLGGEVKEEGPVRHTRGRDYRAHVGLGDAGSLELGDRRAEQTLASLQALGLSHWQTARHRHAHVSHLPADPTQRGVLQNSIS